MRAYGKPYAPLWPLWRIPKHTKVIVIYGETDWFVNTVDARRLIGTLQGYGIDVTDHKVPAKVWNHVDSIMAKGTGRIVLDQVIQYLDMYS